MFRRGHSYNVALAGRRARQEVEAAAGAGGGGRPTLLAGAPGTFRRADSRASRGRTANLQGGPCSPGWIINRLSRTCLV